MALTQGERQRIADVVRQTRVDKGLDKEAAADAAGLNSITWKRVEDALGVRDVSLGKVLSSLGFPSTEAALASGYSAEDALHQRIAQLWHQLDALANRRGRMSGDEWSDVHQAEVDQCQAQLATAQSELARLQHQRHQAVEDARVARLVNLWMLASRLGHPDALDTTELMDAAVALARQVTAYAEAEVGGYSRMRELCQARDSAESSDEPKPGLVGQLDAATTAAAAAAAPPARVTELQINSRDDDSEEVT